MIPRMGSREEHRAVRENAGHWLLPEVGVLRATGSDRLTWANGMVTNDVGAVPDGGATPAAVVSVKGKLIALLDVWRDVDAVLFLVEAGRAPVVRPILEKYIIMEEVDLLDRSADLRVVTVQGPEAASVVRGLHVEARPKDRSGSSGFDLLVPVERVSAVTEEIAARGAVPVGEEPAEWLRIEAGVRRWGYEVGEDTFPQEARLESTHVSFTKGCYVGQEMVVRLRDRGHANRLLVGLDLGETTPPEREAPVHLGDAPVGEVTSAVASPTLGRTVAMAMVKRPQAGEGTELSVHEAAARVVPLPFVGGAGR